MHLYSRFRHGNAAFLLTGLSFVLAAAPAHAAARDACSVITAADAEAALGEPVGPPKSEPRPSPQGDGSACRYRSAQGSAFKAKSVSLSIQYANSDITGSMSGVKANLTSNGMKNVHDVSGVGDAAIWATSSVLGKAMGELTVRKGKSIMLMIVITGFPDEATAIDRAKALALKTLPKI